MEMGVMQEKLSIGGGNEGPKVGLYDQEVDKRLVEHSNKAILGHSPST
jgi:hypothetical protein